MNSPFNTSCRLLGAALASLCLVVAVCLSTAFADPIVGRDILKFSQRPMIDTAIPNPIPNPNPNLLAGAVDGTPNGFTRYGGHDEISTIYGFRGFGPFDLPTSYSGLFMADDFADKLSTPVVHIKWWGSYIGDRLVQPVNQFLIAFESDQPVDANNPFSHPDQPLLTQVVSRGPLSPGSGTFTEKLIRGPDPVRHESLYEYNAELHLDKPFPEQADTIYWLKIAAMVDVFPNGSNFNPYDPTGNVFFGDRPTAWGWHNRDYTISNLLASSAVAPGEILDGTINGAPIYHFQDDAVTGRLIANLQGPGGPLMPSITQTHMMPTSYANFADGPGPTPGAVGINHYSKDLAFEIYTANVPEPSAVLIVACGSVLMLLANRQLRRTID